MIAFPVLLPNSNINSANQEQIKTYFAWSFSLFLLLCTPMPSNAATVNLNGDGTVQSITELNVSGTLYDATFYQGVSFTAVWDLDDDGNFGESDGSLVNHAPAFWNQQTLAQSAAQAVLGALSNTHKTTHLSGREPKDGFRVPFRFSWDGITMLDFYYDESREIANDLILLEDNGGPPDGYNIYEPWVVFEASPVPIPAAAWLFGSGLLGLIGFSKRKKAA